MSEVDISMVELEDNENEVPSPPPPVPAAADLGAEVAALRAEVSEVV